MSLWWLQSGWTETTCANCGRRIWPEGDPDHGLCFSCWQEAYVQREAERAIMKQQERYMADPRDPRNDAEMAGRDPIFRNHNCWRCKDGTDLSRCPTPDRPGNCGYPMARND